MAEVIIVGAGMAGAVAAGTLAAAGHRVRVLDKGFAPGGRLSTRTEDGAVFDLGAQFLTAQSEAFRSLVAQWEAAGVVQPWFRGSPDLDAPADPDGHVRYRGTPSMRAVVSHLLTGHGVDLGVVVGALAVRDGRWQVHLADRVAGSSSRRVWPAPDGTSRTLTADAVLLTCPVPQALELLAAGGTELPSAAAERLAGATYDPCLTLLGVPAGPTALPDHGGLRLPEGPVAWLSDHLRRGSSPQPALTLHATGAYSRDRLEAPDDQVARELLAAARPHLDTDIEVRRIHRWRYATPTASPGPEPLVTEVAGLPVAVAGDVFAGGRVEGAAISGLDTAAALVARLAG